MDITRNKQTNEQTKKQARQTNTETSQYPFQQTVQSGIVGKRVKHSCACLRLLFQNYVFYSRTGEETDLQTKHVKKSRTFLPKSEPCLLYVRLIWRWPKIGWFSTFYQPSPAPHVSHGRFEHNRHTPLAPNCLVDVRHDLRISRHVEALQQRQTSANGARQIFSQRFLQLDLAV